MLPHLRGYRKVTVTQIKVSTPSRYLVKLCIGVTAQGRKTYIHSGGRKDKAESTRKEFRINRGRVRNHGGKPDEPRGFVSSGRPSLLSNVTRQRADRLAVTTDPPGSAGRSFEGIHSLFSSWNHGGITASRDTVFPGMRLAVMAATAMLLALPLQGAGGPGCTGVISSGDVQLYHAGRRITIRLPPCVAALSSALAGIERQTCIGESLNQLVAGTYPGSPGAAVCAAHALAAVGVLPSCHYTAHAVGSAVWTRTVGAADSPISDTTSLLSVVAAALEFCTFQTCVYGCVHRIMVRMVVRFPTPRRAAAQCHQPQQQQPHSGLHRFPPHAPNPARARATNGALSAATSIAAAAARCCHHCHRIAAADLIARGPAPPPRRPAVLRVLSVG